MSALYLAIISFALSIIAIKLLLRIAPHLGLLDLPDHRKHHDGAIPIVGGLALYSTLLIMLLSGMVNVASATVLMLSMTLVTVVGAIDDRNHISPHWRLLMQLVVALLLVYGADLRIEHLGSISFDGERVYLGSFSVAFTVICVISVINAMNFIDGLDGLAGGLALIAISGLWFVFSAKSLPVPDLLPVLSGGLAAFLLFNARWFGRKKAALFLGDAGSTLLGLLLAWLIIDYAQGSNQVISPVVGVSLLAVPIIDLIAIVMRRIMMGRSPFHPDREHLHHIVIRLGKTDKQTVNTIHLTATAIAIFGIIGQLYAWPKNIMFYILIALCISAYYLLKRITPLPQAEQKVTSPYSVIQSPTASTAAFNSESSSLQGPKTK